MSDTSLLDLPDDVLTYLLWYVGQHLLGVCKRLRALYHGAATSVKLTRSYEGGSDDAQVAILARCPRLRRVDASALEVTALHMPWPLAAVTQLTSLAVHWFWGAGNVPPTLAELHVCTGKEVASNIVRWACVSLAQRLRDTQCSVVLAEACDYDSLQALSAAGMDGRVFVLECYSVTIDELDALSARSALLSRLRVLTLGSLVEKLPASSACCAQSVTNLNLSYSELPRLEGLKAALLSRLARLELVSCHSLTTLCCMSGLQELVVHHCSALVSVQCSAPGLCHLDMRGAPALTALDWGADNQGRLRRLRLLGVPRLDVTRALAQVTGITRVDVDAPANALPLPAAAGLLEARFARHVPSAAFCYQMTNVTHLSIAEAASLVDLACFGEMWHLSYLGVRGCAALTSLAGLQCVQRLGSVAINNCPELVSVGALQQATTLTSLEVTGSYISGRGQPLSLHGLQGCVSLRSLKVVSCTFKGDLRGLSLLSSLQLIGRRRGEVNCDVIPGLNCNSLLSARLRIFYTASLESLAGASKLTKLTLIDLPRLSSLRSLSSATSLRELYVEDCRELTSLAPLGNLPTLTSLVLSGPFDVDYALDGLEGASRLAALTLHHFRNETLRLEFPSLQYLECTYCRFKRLDDLHGLQQLTSLRLCACNVTTLELGGASRLARLELQCCERLRSLVAEETQTLDNIDIFVERCPLLTSLQGLHVYRYP